MQHTDHCGESKQPRTRCRVAIAGQRRQLGRPEPGQVRVPPLVQLVDGGPVQPVDRQRLAGPGVGPPPHRGRHHLPDADPGRGGSGRGGSGRGGARRGSGRRPGTGRGCGGRTEPGQVGLGDQRAAPPAPVAGPARAQPEQLHPAGRAALPAADRQPGPVRVPAQLPEQPPAGRMRPPLRPAAVHRPQQQPDQPGALVRRAGAGRRTGRHRPTTPTVVRAGPRTAALSVASPCP